MLGGPRTAGHFEIFSGGADRDRTDDLRLAKPALSQLSYSPMVGLGRFELPTSRLSGARSKPTELQALPSVSQNRIVREQRSRTLTGTSAPRLNELPAEPGFKRNGPMYLRACACGRVLEDESTSLHLG